MARKLSAMAARRPASSVCGEHAAAAQAGDTQSVVAHQLRRTVQPDPGDLIAPGGDGLDSVAHTGGNRRFHVALFADGGQIDRQAAAPAETVIERFLRESHHPPHRQHPRHARGGFIRVRQNAGLVRQPEQLRQMQRGTRAFLPADHREMVLQTVEIRR